MNWTNSPENRHLIIIMSVVAFVLAFIFQSSTLIILILILGILIGSISKYATNKKTYILSEAVLDL